MKLVNKKTGEIGYFCFANWNDPVLIIMNKDGIQLAKYNSLSELNAEWEDVPEEPKGQFYIDCDGRIFENHTTEYIKSKMQEIGNYFETKEEAKKAVEKLKIYNKLEQKGFVFSGWYYSTEGQLVILADNHEFSETEPEDLTELFGDKIC